MDDTGLDVVGRLSRVAWLDRSRSFICKGRGKTKPALMYGYIQHLSTSFQIQQPPTVSGHPPNKKSCPPTTIFKQTQKTNNQHAKKAEYGYHPRRPPFIPAPRSRSAPPQHCGNGFVQNLKGDPTPLCTNYEDKRFKCGAESCHIYDAQGKQQPYSTLTFHHCQRIGDNGEVKASDQTIQPTRFEADNKAKTLSATGTETGVQGEGYYKCSWNNDKDPNANRPWCHRCNAILYT
ncbi:uncharacterized protein PGTG_03302 [Puccinia graminis f. sp. tritici CRL 75-36-700-3]|uniref:Uncharacterized protein n=1 Tax=Puccinia graminis f. sp. tritici (strain CRL 75-36-700-3 / race SCCL) TaxID=418459 RepID=E3JZ71_PUCGT|nr:uncharacterized protein PGTG_03302 [Puccinia graminis f. sp. tritici CRL 75-36-700-3]EFP77346.1 hypothetical protein PGTG_03302 [Puccinia graminis f. sp. tritici CRL 75-36-700-3]